MNVTITYCVPCRYLPRAEAARDAIRDQFGVTSKLVGGRAGVFVVEVDGTKVVSRTKDYFPTTDDILSALRRHTLVASKEMA
jgi:selenoprotein W-related protein